MDFIKLCEGLDGIVWHTALIREAVTLPARYLYHSLGLLCDLVFFYKITHFTGNVNGKFFTHLQ